MEYIMTQMYCLILPYSVLDELWYSSVLGLTSVKWSCDLETTGPTCSRVNRSCFLHNMSVAVCQLVLFISHIVLNISHVRVAIPFHFTHDTSFFHDIYAMIIT